MENKLTGALLLGFAIEIDIIFEGNKRELVVAGVNLSIVELSMGRNLLKPQRIMGVKPEEELCI